MRKALDDPYLKALRRLNRIGVRYVVVGMAGINYYAKNPAETFASMDYDVFLDPTLRNVEAAVRSLRSLGYAFGTTAGPVVPAALKSIVRDRRTLVATTPEGLTIELLLKISGYPFAELAKDAVTFTVNGVPVRVGRLSKLLTSKRLAGRPKDRAFLARYRHVLTE